MTHRPTDAERIDQAVSAVLEGRAVALPPTLASELAAARIVRSGLPAVPPGASFEEALTRRLADAPPGSPGRLVGGFIRQHQRLILTGALGSVLVSTAGAAVVAWRLANR
jgi:hypothetical protein